MTRFLIFLGMLDFDEKGSVGGRLGVRGLGWAEGSHKVWFCGEREGENKSRRTDKMTKRDENFYLSWKINCPHIAERSRRAVNLFDLMTYGLFRSAFFLHVWRTISSTNTSVPPRCTLT